MPNPSFRLLAAPLVLGLVAACGGSPAPTGSPGSSGPPDSSPGTSPEGSPTGGIAYPTDAEAIVLRFEEGGGFVPAEFSATNAPIFTLYGDRTVVFRDVTQPPAESNDPFIRGVPFHTARLTEEQVQGLLDFALNQGGLGVARDRYDHPMVADASTATFEVHVEGLDKTVDVYALGFEDPNVPDPVIRRAFQQLAERLRSFDQGGAVDVPLYEPTAYRGVLIDAGGAEGIQTRPWPFDDISPDEFETPLQDPDLPSLPLRVFTPEEVTELGIEDLTGGLSGLYLETADGKVFSFALRPLLPDETS